MGNWRGNEKSKERGRQKKRSKGEMHRNNSKAGWSQACPGLFLLWDIAGTFAGMSPRKCWPHVQARKIIIEDLRLSVSAVESGEWGILMKKESAGTRVSCGESKEPQILCVTLRHERSQSRNLQTQAMDGDSPEPFHPWASALVKSEVGKRVLPSQSWHPHKHICSDSGVEGLAGKWHSCWPGTYEVLSGPQFKHLPKEADAWLPW